MKKLDAYIIKKFLGTVLFTVLLFIMIAVVIDLSERIDDFIEKGAPFNLIVNNYYANFIPHIVFLLSPLFICIAVIFFTSKLASRSEIIAILASGVSFYRLLFVPYFISAAILVGIQWYANHYWIPNANKERLEFESQYIRKRYVSRDRNIHIQIDPKTFIYMETYNNRDSIGRNFTLERIVNRQLEYKLTAGKIQWDGEKGKWKLSDYYDRSIDGLKEKITEGEKLDTTFNFLPSDFERKIRYKEAMTTPELTAFINKEISKGAPFVEFYEVEKHRRNAVPFATFILTIIGLSIASRRSRGGTGFHIFAGIALCAAFIIFMQFSTTFATKGNLSPLLSVWIPNIIFAILSIYLLLTAPK